MSRSLFEMAALSFEAGFINGWDQVADNNSKTIVLGGRGDRKVPAPVHHTGTRGAQES